MKQLKRPNSCASMLLLKNDLWDLRMVIPPSADMMRIERELSEEPSKEFDYKYEKHAEH
jgi:hypothetical protein